MAHLLRRKGIVHEYESRFYGIIYLPPGELAIRWGGFCPDFYLPPTAFRPGMNIELTFADRGLPTMSQHQRAANLRRLQLKRLKIALTRERYGIETILITRDIFSKLRRDDRHLDRLIRNATIRHERSLRRDTPQLDVA